MAQELWQLYDDQAHPIAGQGATKDDIFGKGLLHGASHVWIWRNNNGAREILLQKRAGGKRTWPHRLDISAAGHIDLDEEPLTAALRETKEEVGLEIDSQKLVFLNIQRMHMTTDIGVIENEFQWVYLLELPEEFSFSLQKSEVDLLIWKTVSELRSEYATDMYVPHSQNYYEMILSAVETA